jgi:hypothetical protein
VRGKVLLSGLIITRESIPLVKPSHGAFIHRRMRVMPPEFLVYTKSGTRVRLSIELDAHSVHQVYAYLAPPGKSVEERLLCNAWGRRKTPDGIKEGVVLPGLILEISRSDWLEVFLEREDLHARENLRDIHLVRIFSRGDRLTIDGYTLSARVDRATWKTIAPHMREVDSGENDEIYEGDHFTGWVIQEGMERTVEDLLGVKPENKVFG